MPKKTRKDKIRADNRRSVPQLQFTFAAAAPIQHHAPTINESVFIKKDITKTIGIASLFIIFEFILYVISIRLGW